MLTECPEILVSRAVPGIYGDSSVKDQMGILIGNSRLTAWQVGGANDITSKESQLDMWEGLMISLLRTVSLTGGRG